MSGDADRRALVVGETPVGLAAATLLHRAGLDATLAAGRSVAPPRTGPALVGPAGLSVLGDLGVGDRVDGDGRRVEGLAVTADGTTTTRGTVAGGPEDDRWSDAPGRSGVGPGGDVGVGAEDGADRSGDGRAGADRSGGGRSGADRPGDGRSGDRGDDGGPRGPPVAVDRGDLHGALDRRLPDAVDRTPAVELLDGPDGVRVRTDRAGGPTGPFDVVVAADGPNSFVRTVLDGGQPAAGGVHEWLSRVDADPPVPAGDAGDRPGDAGRRDEAAGDRPGDAGRRDDGAVAPAAPGGGTGGSGPGVTTAVREFWADGVALTATPLPGGTAVRLAVATSGAGGDRPAELLAGGVAALPPAAATLAGDAPDGGFYRRVPDPATDARWRDGRVAYCGSAAAPVGSVGGLEPTLGFEAVDALATALSSTGSVGAALDRYADRRAERLSGVRTAAGRRAATAGYPPAARPGPLGRLATLRALALDGVAGDGPTASSSADG